MWRKRSRPAPEDLAVRDDLDQARAIRQEAQSGLIDLRKQEPFVQRLAGGMINRQGKNHYMELLYQHVPRGSA